MSIFVLRLDTTQPHSYILKKPIYSWGFSDGGKYNHLTATYGIVWQIFTFRKCPCDMHMDGNKEIKVTIVHRNATDASVQQND